MPRQAARRKIDLYEEGEEITSVELAVVPATPAKPDTKDLEFSKNDIAALATFRVTDDLSYVEAQKKFLEVTAYMDKVKAKFDEPVSAANKVHKFMTGLRGFFLKPAEAAKANLTAQSVAYKEAKERARLAEERRLQAEEEARQRAERERLRAESEARAAEERARYEQQIADIMPWEEAPAPPEPATVLVPEIVPEPVVVRLPPSVPVIAGGPQFRKKPWAARFVPADAESGTEDGRVRFLRWVLANPVDRLSYIDFDTCLSRLRPKATELGADLGKVVDGVEGYQGETLAG